MVELSYYITKERQRFLKQNPKVLEDLYKECKRNKFNRILISQSLRSSETPFKGFRVEKIPMSLAEMGDDLDEFLKKEFSLQERIHNWKEDALNGESYGFFFGTVNSKELYTNDYVSDLVNLNAASNEKYTRCIGVNKEGVLILFIIENPVGFNGEEYKKIKFIFEE